MPLSAVDDYAETVLAPQISQLPGVAQVLVYGAQKFAVRVQVDPVAAAARNISLDDIRSVVAKANSSAPVGTLQGKNQAVTLLATGAMQHAADYRDVVVAYRNGAPIKLNEVARVIDSVENDKIATWFNDCARHRAGDPAPARRQHRRSGGHGARQAAADARAGAAGDPDGAAVRPLDLDPRRRRQRAGDAGDRDLPGHHGDLPVPAEGLRHHHPGAGGAGVADRHLRGDVCLRLLHQQHDAAGADAVGRLRGRRRHRHAGEHRAPYRGRHAPVRGGAERLARDRLHHRVDHLLADRGVHPGAADGRHGRPRVPRIRGVDLGGDHRLRLRLADADADAVRARAQEPSRPTRSRISCCAASSACSSCRCTTYEWTLDRVLKATSRSCWW